MELTYEDDNESVVCSECNKRSNTEIENKIHVHVNHRPVIKVR
jgi:hypothetical protein